MDFSQAKNMVNKFWLLSDKKHYGNFKVKFIKLQLFTGIYFTIDLSIYLYKCLGVTVKSRSAFYVWVNRIISKFILPNIQLRKKKIKKKYELDYFFRI